MTGSPIPRMTAADVVAIYDRCEAAGVQIWIDGGVRFHTGYPPRDTDRHDVKLLCERFSIPLLTEYR